jgi:hypothetical protein
MRRSACFRMPIGATNGRDRRRGNPPRASSPALRPQSRERRPTSRGATDALHRSVDRKRRRASSSRRSHRLQQRTHNTRDVSDVDRPVLSRSAGLSSRQMTLGRANARRAPAVLLHKRSGYQDGSENEHGNEEAAGGGPDTNHRRHPQDVAPSISYAGQ